MPGPFVTPMDWANAMLEAFGGGNLNGEDVPTPSPETPPTEPPPQAPAAGGENVDELRTQLFELQRRIEELSTGGSRGGEPADTE